MHSDLSPHLHSDECNILIQRLQNCHKENTFTKFLGACNEIDTELKKCLRKDREVKRRKNKEIAELSGSARVIPEIQDSIELQDPFPNVTERYYTERYCIDERGTSEDHIILFHSNRLCLITLAPTHPVFKRKITKIDYASGNVDRTKNKISGKGKKGGQYLQENSTICSIFCEDGEVYKVKSNIKGKLVEVNERLLDNPSLLLHAPCAEGHLAIALPNISQIDMWKEKFLTKQEYETHCNNLQTVQV